MADPPPETFSPTPTVSREIALTASRSTIPSAEES